MEEAIRACEELFRVPGRVAKAILPAIRARDVRAAAPRAIAELRRREMGGAAGRAKAVRRLVHARKVLLKHLEQRERRCRKQYSPLWGSDVYYRGEVVPRVLRLGQYLYYRGAIGRRMLDDALEWQKRRRPLMGQIALRHGMLSPHQFGMLLYSLSDYALFGQAARAQGILTDEELEDIARAQSRYQCRIGDYFVQMGIFPKNRIEEYHRDLCEHNRAHAA